MNDLESMYMDMDTMQKPSPGINAMGNVVNKESYQDEQNNEMLQEMLRKAKEMFPQWPPIAQYMWAQGQIQNFQSNKPPANPQFPMLNNQNYKMTY